MTIIPAENADKLVLGDLYSVEGFGPYMVVEMDDACAKELFGTVSFSYRQGAMALLLSSSQFESMVRSPGDACLIGMTGADKVRADEVRLEPSKIVPAKDVPAGSLFVARPHEFVEEDVFVMGADGRFFRSDGRELRISFFPKDSMAEILEVHTDLAVRSAVCR